MDNELTEKIAKTLYIANYDESLEWVQVRGFYEILAEAIMPYIASQVQTEKDRIFKRVAQLNMECGTYEELSLKLTSFMVHDKKEGL